MTISLQNFSSETIYVQDVSFVVIRFTMKPFLQIFLNSVIYEIFSIWNLLHISYMTWVWDQRKFAKEQILMNEDKGHRFIKYTTAAMAYVI